MEASPHTQGQVGASPHTQGQVGASPHTPGDISGQKKPKTELSCEQDKDLFGL